MGPDSTATADVRPEALYHWSARKLQPVVLLYVALVFLFFIVVALFGFHSPKAVMALALTAVAAIVPLVPTVLIRDEYRLTEEAIDRRSVDKERPKTFEELVRLDQLSHIVPMRHGFKFYKHLEEPSLLRRFWKLHVSDEYSGEVHVEKADREGVFEMVERRGVSIR